MDLDVAGDVAGAGQEAGVVRPLGLEPGGDIGDVAELPDLDGGANGQAVGRGGQGQTHRRLERAEVGVHRPVLLADDDELAGLVGRHQQRDPPLAEQARQVRRMAGAERLGGGDGRGGIGVRLRGVVHQGLDPGWSFVGSPGVKSSQPGTVSEPGHGLPAADGQRWLPGCSRSFANEERLCATTPETRAKTRGKGKGANWCQFCFRWN